MTYFTAAHCSERIPNGWTLANVKLGEYDITTNPDCKLDAFGDRECNDPHVVIKIAEKLIHNGYVPLSKDQHNDIALLRMASPVKYTKYIKPVCLPTESGIKTKNWNNIEL